MKARQRFARRDWLELGLRQLAGQGPAGLTLESLCAAADRTRGSFYHHFREHSEFVAAMTDLWRQRNTAALILATAEGDVGSRLQRLNHLAVRLNGAVELGMRNLGAVESQVRAEVRRVDEARIDYLAELRGSRSSADPSSCRKLARIEYAAFVGGQVLWPEAAPEELEALGLRLAKLID